MCSVVPSRDISRDSDLPRSNLLHGSDALQGGPQLTSSLNTPIFFFSQKMRGPVSPMGNLTENITRRLQSFTYSQGLYSNLPGSGLVPEPTSPTSPTTQHKPRMTITSAPDVSSPTLPTSPKIPVPEPIATVPSMQNAQMTIAEAPKKKYAKEAWPGKKPTPSLLI